MSIHKNTVPPITDEGRLSKLISLTLDLVEQQIRDGSATSQVLTHFLKLADKRAEVELARAKLDTRLVESKIAALEAQTANEQTLTTILDALRKYTVQPVNDYEFDDY